MPASHCRICKMRGDHKLSCPARTDGQMKFSVPGESLPMPADRQVLTDEEIGETPSQTLQHVGRTT